MTLIVETLKLYVGVGLISGILTYAGMKFVEWLD